jgi:hypothetical protein
MIIDAPVIGFEFLLYLAKTREIGAFGEDDDLGGSRQLVDQSFAQGATE